jgi:hypothetical protein
VVAQTCLTDGHRANDTLEAETCDTGRLESSASQMCNVAI